MPIDFNKFKKKDALPKEVDPIKIYDGLARSGGLNDLWRGQYLALEEWQDNRDEKEVTISLNTGGGKTVIGLLQGQSIVNETLGKVFYLCGSIQLIKQTEEFASSMPLKVATYYNRNLEREAEFNKGEVLCLTTYQAMFNGLSRFAREPILGLIFDDAHVASHIIRDHFTLRITDVEFANSYSTLVNSVKSYYDQIHSGQLFDQVVNQKNDPAILFIPTFIWEEINVKVTDVLLSEGVAENKSTKYAWEHLRDNLDLCAVFLTSRSIEITPFLAPVHLLKFMQHSTKKIFLSATVQDEPDFIRSFGFRSGKKIEPKTRAGESERLIVTPYVKKEISEYLFQHIIQLSKSRKILIIPNSERRARRWREHESRFSSKDFSEKVNEFKSSSTGLLVAPARFEGMDFPNDTCRSLVIDGLPSGTGLLEKFQWNSLGEVRALQGTIASRVVQSMGRISRGNDDYGIVYLLGNDLADWITRKLNRERLPSYIRAQLELGERITEELTSIEELQQFEQAVLEREDGWSDLHQEEIKNALIEKISDESESKSKEEKFDIEVAISERSFIRHFWNREYAKAAKALETNLDKLFEEDKGLAAWHSHWIGYSYLKYGNQDIAYKYFNRSAKSFKALGLIPDHNEKQVVSTIIPDEETQAGRIIKFLSTRGEINYGTFSQLDDRLAPFFNAARVSSNSYEEALRWLGLYLGFQSSRPDSESGIGRGPDVFWLSPEVAIMIESKEEKSGKTPYSKKEVGQSFNHLEWINEEFLDHKFSWELVIVGPDIEAAPAASPSEEMKILLPEEVISLANRIRQLLFDTWKKSTPSTFYSELEKNLAEGELKHMDILNLIPQRPIRKSNMK
ncbi:MULTISPECIES: helicase C-terminal domain-containing protein [Cytobacillus]|uniref:Helicase ATP-binding domain-containing protein n=1 Tax=Cytobacillus oceanisediminis TaxID=665099 RepID=A0ABX3CK14_9BACI|nr:MULTISPECIES: helicase C-terminal domain-containing protein [Cytobacillus]OHX41425.1 hypothetical protein BBV17_28950 [Cytobacillus oceanisediminis]